MKEPAWHRHLRRDRAKARLVVWSQIKQHPSYKAAVHRLVSHHGSAMPSLCCTCGRKVFSGDVACRHCGSTIPAPKSMVPRVGRWDGLPPWRQDESGVWATWRQASSGRWRKRVWKDTPPAPPVRADETPQSQRPAPSLLQREPTQVERLRAYLDMALELGRPQAEVDRTRADLEEAKAKRERDLPAGTRCKRAHEALSKVERSLEKLAKRRTENEERRTKLQEQIDACSALEPEMLEDEARLQRDKVAKEAALAVARQLRLEELPEPMQPDEDDDEDDSEMHAAKQAAAEANAVLQRLRETRRREQHEKQMEDEEVDVKGSDQFDVMDSDLDSDRLLDLLGFDPVAAQDNPEITKRARDFADLLNAERAERAVKQKTEGSTGAQNDTTVTARTVSPSAGHGHTSRDDRRSKSRSRSPFEQKLG